MMKVDERSYKYHLTVLPGGALKASVHWFKVLTLLSVHILQSFLYARLNTADPNFTVCFYNTSPPKRGWDGTIRGHELTESPCSVADQEEKDQFVLQGADFILSPFFWTDYEQVSIQTA